MFPTFSYSQSTILSLEDLSKESEQTIIANCLSYFAYSDASNQRIFTDYILKVDQAIKGDLSANSLIKITVPGGTLNGYTTFIPEIPVFTKGEETLLFLEEKKSKAPENRKFVVTGFHQGKYVIVLDEKTKKKIVYRDKVDFPLRIKSNGETLQLTAHESIYLSDFVSLITTLQKTK